MTTNCKYLMEKIKSFQKQIKFVNNNLKWNLMYISRTFKNSKLLINNINKNIVNNMVKILKDISRK